MNDSLNAPARRSDNDIAPVSAVDQHAGRPLPTALTSYDLLKSLAFIAMVIDHVGYYLLPDQPAWRIVGRVALPIWLFLIGYARTRDIGWPLFGSACLLLASNAVFGEHLLPLNVLFTIMLARVLIDPVMAQALHARIAMMAILTALFAIGMPTMRVLDYGSHALLFAMLGYLVRHRRSIDYSKRELQSFAVLIGCLHGLTQSLLFATEWLQALLIVALVGSVTFLLVWFRPVVFSVLTQHMPAPVIAALQLMGRHSLPLFVLHLLVLKLIAVALVADDMRWFDWYWTFDPARSAIRSERFIDG